MKPLVLHRLGVAQLSAGQREPARASFREALNELDLFLVDPATPPAVRARAELMPGWSGKGDILAGEWLEALPTWLTEWHFEQYYSALIGRHLWAARLHWELVRLASQLPRLAAAAQLALRRDSVCVRLQVDHVSVTAAGNTVPVACRHADLILSVDPLNLTARSLAISGYRHYAQRAIDAERNRGRRVLMRSGLSRPGLRRRLRVATRMLNRHLTAARGSLDAQMVGSGYVSLAHYCLMLGDADRATKVVRRARRLTPDDPELKQLLRRIKFMPRAR